jgi:RNA 2',3'-cyclic 3'-phosphodiesterase
VSEDEPASEQRPAGKPIRAFVALELPESVREAVAAVVRDLKPRLPDVRWVREEGVHATLRFLGWTRAETLAALEAPLASAVAECPPLEVGVNGLGMFPDRGSPRVLWLGMDLPGPGLALQAACERAAVAAGFPREERAFHPHLTLGRWRDRARRPSLPDARVGSGRVDQLVLFRSQLAAAGSVYTPLATFPLGGAPAAVR